MQGPRRTTFLVVCIAAAVMCSILLVTETTRPAATALVATGGVAWGLVSFFEWRRSLRQQAAMIGRGAVELVSWIKGALG